MRRSPALAILAIVMAVLVIAVGFASGPSARPPADLIDYVVSADGRRLVVTVVVPRQCDVDRATADETTTTVRVTVTLSCSGSATGGDAPLIEVPISLATPLGSRVVLDANGGAVALRPR